MNFNTFFHKKERKETFFLDQKAFGIIYYLFQLFVFFNVARIVFGWKVQWNFEVAKVKMLKALFWVIERGKKGFYCFFEVLSGFE